MTSAKRKRRRWGLWCVALLAVFLVLVALLPFLVSSVLRKPLLGLVGSQLGAHVEADAVRLSWGGEQTLVSLRVSTPEDDSEVLRIDRARISSGLFALALSPQETIVIDADGVTVDVVRRSDGSFNFDGLFPGGEDEPQGKPKPPRQSPPEAKGPKPDSLPKAIELPALPRAVEVVINNAELSYRDEILGTFGAVRGGSLRLAAEGRTAEWKLETRLASAPQDTHGNDGSVSLSGQLLGLGEKLPSTAVEASADLAIRGLSLAPYRGLIEELASVSPPEAPIEGDFRCTLEKGALTVTSQLDTGILTVEKLTLNIPGKPTESMELRALVRAKDLEAAQKFVQGLWAPPEGTRLAGSLEVAVEGGGTGSLNEILEGHTFEDGPFSLRLSASLSDLLLEWPQTEGEPTEPEGAVREPLRVEEKEAKFSVLLEKRNDPTAAPLAYELSSQSKALKASLRGTLVDAAIQAEGTVQLQLPALIEQLSITLPSNLRVSEDTRISLEALKATASLDDEDPASTMEASGHIAIAGEVFFDGYDFRSLDADLEYREKVATLKDLGAALSDGRLTAKELVVDFTKQPPEYRGGVSLENIRATYEMTKLLAYAVPFLSLDDERADFSGRLAAELQIEGRGFAREELESSLKGAGKLRIRDGKLTASKFFLSVVNLFGGEEEDLHFSELGSDFDIGESRVLAHKVFLQPRADSKLRNLGLNGVTKFDGTLDFSVDLATLQETIGDKRIRRILEGTRKFLGGDSFPLRLRGTLETPQLDLVLPFNSEPSAETPPSLNLEDALQRGLGEILRGTTKPKDGKGSDSDPQESNRAPSEATRSPGQEPIRIDDIFDLFKKKKKRKKRENKQSETEDGDSASKS